MSISNTGEMKRRPTHPGEMLREDFLPDYGLTATSLAQAARNDRTAKRHTLWEILKRVRTAVKADHGDDSSEYEMFGGTRMSERK